MPDKPTRSPRSRAPAQSPRGAQTFRDAQLIGAGLRGEYLARRQQQPKKKQKTVDSEKKERGKGVKWKGEEGEVIRWGGGNCGYKQKIF